MTLRILCLAIAVLVATCVGCHDRAHAPTKQSQSTTNRLSKPAEGSVSAETPAATPHADASQSEAKARGGLNVDLNVGEDGVRVDVGEDRVNVDVGQDGVNVDVGDNGVGVDVGQGGVDVEVGDSRPGEAE